LRVCAHVTKFAPEQFHIFPYVHAIGHHRQRTQYSQLNLFGTVQSVDRSDLGNRKPGIQRDHVIAGKFAWAQVDFFSELKVIKSDDKRAKFRM
jgi:hypothetical protein